MTFDEDLNFGKKGESLFLKLIKKKYPQARIITGYNKGFDILIPETDMKVECKFDRFSRKSGNVAIEYEYNGEPSGIHATQADFWGLIYYSTTFDTWVYVLIKTDVLQLLCREARQGVFGGDGKKSRMFLIEENKITFNPYYDVQPLKGFTNPNNNK